MKARLNRLSVSGLGVALGAVLVSASAAWGQSSSSSIPPAMAGSILTIVLVCCIATYIYMALGCKLSLSRRILLIRGWRGCRLQMPS